MNSAIRRTQEEYFEVLEAFFGDYYKKMSKTGKAAWEMAVEAVRVYDDSMAKVESDLLNDELNDLWERRTQQLRNEIRGVGGVKAVYRGADVPLGGINFAKRSALYMDMTMIEDPISISLIHRETLNYRMLIAILVEYSLRMLEVMDLAVACEDVQPLVIVPPYPYWLQTERKHLRKQAIKYALNFWSDVLGRNFKSMKELKDFIFNQGTPERLLEHLKKPELFSDPDHEIGPVETLKQFMQFEFNVASSGSYGSLGDPQLLADVFFNSTLGSLAEVSSQLFSCRPDVMRAEPVTDTTYFWRRLRWVFRHDSEMYARMNRAVPGDYGSPQRPLRADALVLNVLMRDDFRWLGNVPVKDIVRLREDGELDNIRKIFSDGIRDMGGAELEELPTIARQVKDNWNRAVDKHKGDVRKLRIDAGLSAGTVLAGTIGVMTPQFSPAGWITALGTGARLGRDLAKLAEYNQRPVAILLKAKESAT